MNIINEILLSTAGVSFLLLIVARLVPNDKLKALGVSAGKAISAFGGKKMGPKVWEKVEDFLENSVKVFLEGVKEGLDSDDKADTNA
jgi:phage-related tail protein